MALALARKYRPRTFASVAVQSHVSNTLRGAIARGRVAHGYLLCGPRGVGKTTLARVLAMALNCERRTPGDSGEPCGECTSCTRIWSGSASLDVIEIDAASNRGVDDARELRERAMYAPSGDERYKVYIVDEAHMLTREAWNALLKILEEPPPRVVFVFATTEPQKIAQTAAPVLSRLQRFDFKRMSVADIRERLALILREEQVEADADALSTIARAADGSMRDALSLADQVLSLGGGAVTGERVREALGLVPEDEFIGILDLIAERRAGDVFPAVARLADAGIDFGIFLTGFSDVLRAQLAIVLGGEPSGISERARGELEARRDRLSAADLLRMLNALSELEQRFRKSAQQQLLLETLLVRFALLDRSIDLEEVLRGLGGGSERDASRARGAPASVPDAGGGGASGTWAGRSRGEEPRVESAGRTGARDEMPSGATPDRTGAHEEMPSDATPRRTGARDEASSGTTSRDEFASTRRGFDSASARSAPVRDADSGFGGSGAAVAVAPPAAPASAVSPAAPRTVPAPAAAAPASQVATSPAPRPQASTDVGIPELHTLVEHWDDIVERVRRTGRSTLTAALQHALPVAITARGIVTVQLDQPNDIYAKAFEAGREEVAAAIRELHPAVTRVSLRVPSTSDAAPQARLTEESLRAERLALLRKRDPVLDAAIDTLDLELLD